MEPIFFLELPYNRPSDAKMALLRGVYRRAAVALRKDLGYPGAALALEALAETLRAPHPVDDDGETTVVDADPFA